MRRKTEVQTSDNEPVNTDKKVRQHAAEGVSLLPLHQFGFHCQLLSDVFLLVNKSLTLLMKTVS